MSDDPRDGLAERGLDRSVARRDERRKPTARDLRLLTLYGITEAEYDVVLKCQEGACYICRRPPKTVRLSADHDHRTGVFRGLLCMSCNRGLQMFQDNADRLRRAMSYLVASLAVMNFSVQPRGRPGRSTRKWRTKREKRERMTWVAWRLRELDYEVPPRLRRFLDM